MHTSMVSVVWERMAVFNSQRKLARIRQKLISTNLNMFNVLKICSILRIQYFFLYSGSQKSVSRHFDQKLKKKP